MFKWIMGKRGARRADRAPEQPEPEKQPERYAIPTVKFDASTVTEPVIADLERNIRSLKEVGPENFDAVFKVALFAIRAGNNLHPLYQALIAIDGMSKKRASEISHSLSTKANALVILERQKRIGIKYAIWRSPRVAPCGKHDAAHKAANDKVFLLAKGI